MYTEMITMRLDSLRDEHTKITNEIKNLKIQLSQLSDKKLQLEGAFMELTELCDAVKSAEMKECAEMEKSEEG